MRRFKQCTLTLTFSCGVEREGRNLTAPLTFILFRKGREELKEYPLTLTLSRGVERE
jgi:hypothetical protein